jgi:DNA-binding transcriptional regulator YdaS (Cro superfamily)
MIDASLKALLKRQNIKPATLARELKVDKSQITRWAQKKVPAERVLDVERITGISRHEMRPDVFGAKSAKKRRAA